VSERKIQGYTVLASLVVHAILAVLTWNFDFLSAGVPMAAAAAEPSVELVLVPELEGAEADEPAKREPDQPDRYTEIPDRLAGERPDRADFLSSRDSRAADRLPGGQDGDQPGTVREGEFPQVAIAPENLAGAEGVTVEPPALTPPPRPSRAEDLREPAETPAEAEARQRGAEAAGVGDDLLPAPARDGGETRREAAPEPAPPTQAFDDWLAGQSTPSLLKEGRQQAPGDRGFDFSQLEQGRIGTNVDLDGDFSLNTYEWNFAPWMRRFVNDLHRSWIAPYAYRLGVIDGYTRIRLVVERDGRPSSMEIFERQGHESLHTASVAALQAFAPYAPLPPDFPEDQLVILLGLHYPAWKR